MSGPLGALPASGRAGPDAEAGRFAATLIRGEVREGIAVVTMCAPPWNLWNAQLVMELRAALDWVGRTQPRAGACILHGRRIFSAGGAVPGLLTDPVDGHPAGALCASIETLIAGGTEVITAAEGYVVGEALRAARATTRVVVGDNTKFAWTEPDGRTRWCGAAEAASRGWCDDIVAPDDVFHFAWTVARERRDDTSSSPRVWD